MLSPAANIALTVLGVFVFIGIVCFIFKTQVGLFVKTLLAHREKTGGPASTAGETA